MRTWREVRNFASQKFRKSEISLDNGPEFIAPDVLFKTWNVRAQKKNAVFV